MAAATVPVPGATRTEAAARAGQTPQDFYAASYWMSTTNTASTVDAYYLDLTSAQESEHGDKSQAMNVWPVRDDMP